MRLHGLSVRAAAAVDGRVLSLCGKLVQSSTIALDAAITCPRCIQRRPKAMTLVQEAKAQELVTARQADVLDERSVYVSLTQSAIGIRRRIDIAEVAGAKVEGEEGPDHEMLHLAKDIIDQAELKAIQKGQREMHWWLRDRSYRSRIRHGVHRLPLSFVEPMVEFFDKKQQEVAANVEALITRYPEIKVKAKARLGTLYNEADYPHPDTLRAAFRTEYYFAALAVPGQLNVISKDLYARESEKAVARAEEERQLIVAALREQFSHLLGHMVSILETGTDGKAKRFREASLDNAREFFEMFSAKNIGGDTALPPLVERAKALLGDVGAETLKTDEELRSRIKDGFAQVQASMTGMVTFKASRAVRLPD